MATLRKLWRLPRGELWLLACSAVLLSAVRFGLGLFPLATLRRVIARTARMPSKLGARAAPRVDRTIWALDVASRYLPGTSTCLVKALAAYVLLRRQGVPTTLRIGVSRGNGSHLKAHAWLVSEGQVVLGGTPVDLSSYTPLRDLDLIAE